MFNIEPYSGMNTAVLNKVFDGLTGGSYLSSAKGE
jgi:hypothetical protein